MNNREAATIIYKTIELFCKKNNYTIGEGNQLYIKNNKKYRIYFTNLEVVKENNIEYSTLKIKIKIKTQKNTWIIEETRTIQMYTNEIQEHLMKVLENLNTHRPYILEKEKEVTLTPTLTKEFNKIAKKHLSIPTLETRNSDDLDFHEIPVWCLLEAFKEVYKLGQQTK